MAKTLIVNLDAPASCAAWLQSLREARLEDVSVEKPRSKNHLNNLLYAGDAAVVVFVGERPPGRADPAIAFQGEVLGVRDVNALFAEKHGGEADLTRRQVVWVLDGPPYGPWRDQGDVVVQLLGAEADAVGVAQMTATVVGHPLANDPGYPGGESILAEAIQEKSRNSEFDGGYDGLHDAGGGAIHNGWVGSSAGNPLVVHLTSSSQPSGGFIRDAVSWMAGWPSQFQIDADAPSSGNVFVDPRSVASRYPLRRFRGPLVSPASIVGAGDQVWKWATNQQPTGYSSGREGFVILRNNRQIWLELSQGSGRYSYPFVGGFVVAGTPVDFAEVQSSGLPKATAYLWFIADPLP